MFYFMLIFALIFVFICAWVSSSETTLGPMNRFRKYFKAWEFKNLTPDSWFIIMGEAINMEPGNKHEYGRKWFILVGASVLIVVSLLVKIWLL